MFRFTRRTRNATLTLAAAAATCGLFGSYGDHFNTPNGGGAAPPSADPLITLREEFSRLQSEATDVVDLATRENRELTAEEKTANETRFTRMTAIKSTLDERARFAGLALNDPQTRVTRPIDPPGRAEFERREREGHAAADPDKIDKRKFSKALTAWALTGVMAAEFATITTSTEGGVLMPKSIDTPIVPTTANVFREAHQIHGLTPVSTATTENLTIPVLDTAAGGAVAENASSETENEPSLAGSIILNVSTYQSGSAWFSNMQLSATGFDLIPYVQTDLTYAKELGLESAIAAAIIADTGVTQVVPTATTTGFTYDNLVDLNRKLPKRYDRLKVIFLSATAFAAAEKLVGDDGHPVLNKDPQNLSLLRFNGTPVLRCDYFEALAANKVVGCIVSMIGFRLRDAADLILARYTQNPAKPNQTGLNLFGYHGYGWTPAAVAKLKTPAS